MVNSIVSEYHPALIRRQRVKTSENRPPKRQKESSSSSNHLFFCFREVNSLSLCHSGDYVALPPTFGKSIMK